MPRLRHLLGVACVSLTCFPTEAVESLTCPAAHRDAEIPFDDGASDEEVIPLKLLQVHTKLERKVAEAHTEIARAENVPGLERQSVFGNLLVGQVGWLAFMLAIVVPHLAAFSLSSLLRRRAEKGAQKDSVESVEVLKEEEEIEAPRSLAYIIPRIGPMWIIHLLGMFSVAAAAPSLPYMYLNYFAKQHSDTPVDCAVNMAATPCSRAVVEVMQIHVAKGFAGPVVQLLTGPALLGLMRTASLTLGAISDSLGRRPAVLAIRVCMAITSTTSAAVVWFNLSIWWDYWLGFLGLIPFIAVPTAWYVDRVDHAPSIVPAITLVEGSCIFAGIVGAFLGSTMSLKMALLVGMVGKLIDLLLAIFCLPESLSEEKRIPFSWSLLLPTTSFHALLQSPLVEKLTAIGVIDAFHYTGWITILARFLQQHFAWSRHDTYVAGLLDAVSAIAWMIIGVRMLLPSLGRVGLLATSTVSVGVASSMVMLATRRWQIFLQSAMFAGLPLMSSAVLVAIIGKSATAEQQGMLQSTVNLVNQVSGALGGACFMLVYQFLDPTAPGAHSWRMVAYVTYGALFMIPSLMLTFSLRKEIQEPNKAAA